MNSEATVIDQNISFFDSYSHGDTLHLSPLSSPPLSGRDGLKILSPPSPLLPHAPIVLSPHQAEPSKPIPINTCDNTYSSQLTPAAAYPRAASYAGGEISTSPAMAFLSSFTSSPSIIPHRDMEGDVVAGFTLAETIGHGGFSTIRRAYNSSGAIVAVKIVPHKTTLASPQPPRQIENEIAIWSSLNHEHILPLFTHTSTSYADYFFTLYCPAGSLFDILKRDGHPALPQDDVGTMFRQVVRGLRYLHESALLVHRDIKLENVLVDEMGICRISDFGLAKKIGEPQVDDDSQNTDNDNEDHPTRLIPSDIPTSGPVDISSLARASSFTAPPGKRAKAMTGFNSSNSHLSLIRGAGHVPKHRNSTTSHTTNPTLPNHHTKSTFPPGSLPYAAPELLVPQNSSGPILVSAAQDIWALGVLLYTLLKGRLPFNDSFEPRLQMKILQGIFELPPGIGIGAERVIKGCLERSVASRWTIAMVDDVAWGIGWGGEGDGVVGSPEQSTGQPSPADHRSRSRSSTSRARYASTSPVSERHHYHHRHKPHEHELEHHHHLPSVFSDHSSASDLSSRAERSTSSSRSESQAGSGGGRSLLTEAMLATQGERRGRRRHKHLPQPQAVHSASRSPSPIPMTPKDSEYGFVPAHDKKGLGGWGSGAEEL